MRWPGADRVAGEGGKISRAWRHGRRHALIRSGPLIIGEVAQRQSFCPRRGERRPLVPSSPGKSLNDGPKRCHTDRLVRPSVPSSSGRSLKLRFRNGSEMYFLPSCDLQSPHHGGSCSTPDRRRDLRRLRAVPHRPSVPSPSGKPLKVSAGWPRQRQGLAGPSVPSSSGKSLNVSIQPMTMPTCLQSPPHRGSYSTTLVVLEIALPTNCH